MRAISSASLAFAATIALLAIHQASGAAIEFVPPAQGGGDMPVRKGALDLERLLCVQGKALAFQHAPEGVDLPRLPVGEVGQGAALDLLPLAPTLP